MRGRKILEGRPASHSPWDSDARKLAGLRRAEAREQAASPTDIDLKKIFLPSIFLPASIGRQGASRTGLRGVRPQPARTRRDETALLAQALLRQKNEG